MRFSRFRQGFSLFGFQAEEEAKVDHATVLIRENRLLNRKYNITANLIAIDDYYRESTMTMLMTNERMCSWNQMRHEVRI